MTFVRESDRRERQLRRANPVLARPEAGFGETFVASFQYMLDENASISGALNKEGFVQRRRALQSLIDEGELDSRDYQNRRGRINYDELALKYDTIKSTEQLQEERKEILRKRREYNKDIMERGSGLAQFFGALSAFALDPVNVATLPFSSAAVAARSLSWVGKGLAVAKREAALNVAAELAIQPLVFNHKSNIDSPYSYEDAIANITLAAAGGAGLGFVSGGISGYFKAVNQKASPYLDGKESAMALRSLQESANFIDSTRPDDAARIIDEEYGKFLSGDYADIESLRQGALNRLGQELDQANAQRMPILRMIVDEGGLNEKAWKDAGFTADDIAQARNIRKGLPKNKPFLRRKGGLTPQNLIQRLVDIGYIADGEVSTNRALEIVRKAFADPNLDANPQVANKAADVESAISRVSNESAETIEQIFKEGQKQVIEGDAKRLREFERIREEMDNPNLDSNQFEIPETEKVTPQTINERQRYVLDRVGLAEEYDQAMEAYARSERKEIYDPETGRLVEADEVLKDIDEQVEGLNEVLRCTVNA